MKEPLITVVVPTHNSQKFIKECLESVVNQTYKNLQIICVDSSSDRTMDILVEIQKHDSRVEIVQDANGSYGHKLNVGIKQAKGEYIAIVESDDYILPEMFKSMLSGVEDEDVDYIKCNGTNNFADVRGQRVFLPEYFTEIEDDVERIINLEEEREKAFVCLPRIWTALYRRSFLIENKILANETPGASYQDTSFTQLVAFLAKTCIYKKGAFYCYRNDNPESSVKSESKICCVCDEYKYLESVLREQGKYTKQVANDILELKLGTYAWNIRRLNTKSATVFRDAVKAEMDFYKPEAFSVEQKNLFKLIVDENYLEEKNQELEVACRQWSDVLSVVKDEDAVLVGAGSIGKTVHWLQEMLDRNFILAVADNNILGVRDEMGSYSLKSVEEVVKAYSDKYFIVANKYSSKEIHEQLERLGIPQEHIIHIETNLNKLYIWGEYIKQNV